MAYTEIIVYAKNDPFTAVTVSQGPVITEVDVNLLILNKTVYIFILDSVL